MPSFDILVITACFLLVIVFGTHYIRTWAFNRHEAITFECSSAAFLISLLLIIRYGITIRLLIAAIVLFIAFAVNAFSQWHFYMKLQDIIEETFARRLEHFKKEENENNNNNIHNILKTMASVAIMPSFSRFIEESKLFNNPGGFIGLIKSVMKRQRFQKKKYLMRECFAENVSMIGPCKSSIDDPVSNQKDQENQEDQEHIISGAVHANDLALGYGDEKKGLFSYDILGFGGLLFIWYILFDSYHTFETETGIASIPNAIITLIVILAFTCICYMLRHIGFARYESFTYEMTCTSLITVSFLAFTGTLSDSNSSYWMWLIFGAILVLFLAASFANRSMDKGLHKKINKKFEDIIKQIAPDSETNRIKRKFLQNLKVISEWAVVPLPDEEQSEALNEEQSEASNEEQSEASNEEHMSTTRLTEFEQINRNKKAIPKFMEELVDCIVPEYNEKVKESDFRVQKDKFQRIKRILDITGIASVVIIIICIWVGVL